MDELQIIDDILEQLYGYETFFMSNDERLIKEKKREKNEKQDDMIKQIDLMCTMIKKELRSEMGEAFFEINTDLRAFVLDSIHKEVKNGNNVIDSNGKINFKKFKVILLEQKNEIIKENSSKSNTSKEQNNEKKYFENDDKNKEIISDIKGLFAGNGIELSEEEAAKVHDAVNKTNAMQEKYKQYKEMGLNNIEIIEKFKEEYAIEEIANFLTNAGIAIGYGLLKRQNINKEKNQENSGEKSSNLSGTEKIITPMPELAPASTPKPAPVPTPEPAPMPTPEPASMLPQSMEPFYMPTETGYPRDNYGGVYWDNSGWMETPAEDSVTIDLAADYDVGFCELMNAFAQDADLQRYYAEGGLVKDEALVEKVHSSTRSSNDPFVNDYMGKNTLRHITGIIQDYSKGLSTENGRKSYEVSKGKPIERNGRVVKKAKEGKTSNDIQPKGKLPIEEPGLTSSQTPTSGAAKSKTSEDAAEKKETQEPNNVGPKEEALTDEEFDPRYEKSEDEVIISKNEPVLPKMEEMFVLNTAQPAIQSQIEEEKNMLDKIFPRLSSKYPIDQGKEGLPIRNMKILYGQRGSLRDTEESASTVGSLNGTKEERTDGDKTPTTPSDEEKE